MKLIAEEIQEVEYIVEEKEDILERSVSILSDNLVNEILYILKFCNLSNDSENAYIYIIMYETLWFGFKILKSSNKNVIEENEIILTEIMIYFSFLCLNMLRSHLDFLLLLLYYLLPIRFLLPSQLRCHIIYQ